MSDARGAASWDAERTPRCTCTEDESSDGSATYEDDPHCPIHGWCSWRAECGRLREQLDAAREALGEIAGHNGHTSAAICVAMMVEAAHAALEAVGEPQPRFVCPRGHRHHEGSAFCTVCGAGPVLAARLGEGFGGSVGRPEVHHRADFGPPRATRDARAALGVEGEQEKP